MRRLVILVIVFLFLMISGTAQAMVTSDTQDTTNWGDWFVPDGTVLPGAWNNPYYRGANYVHENQDWGWTHTLTYGTAVSDVSQILSATLVINAWQVDPPNGGIWGEVDDIWVGGTYNGSSYQFDGHKIGRLDYNPNPNMNTWDTTTFVITDTAVLTELLDGEVGIFMDIDAKNAGYYKVALDYSTLSVEYIPAPGAVLLAGFGASIVGWLRRRKTL